MANSAPPWITNIMVAVDVGGTPVVAAPANERAAGAVGRYSGVDTSYQTVASWTVAALMLGELKEILIISNTYAKTLCKVTVGSIVWANDWIVGSSLPIIFEDLKLAEAAIVKVEAKSTDATAIIVDAIIVAKEIGG